MTKDALRAVYQERFYENEGLPELIALVEEKHRRILDVGCGNGANMSLLAAEGHQTTGVTLSFSEAGECHRRGLECVVCDLNEELPFVDKSFDALLFSHVLEHVAFPEAVLRKLLHLVADDGAIYVALPNVMQFRQRYEFLRGRFRYAENGLMDRTHLRFFDFKTARQLLVAAGLKVIVHYGVGKVPLRPIRKTFPALARKLDSVGTRWWPGLFAFHILMVGVRE
jgi:methionine biosynthesis protein MetW